MDDVSIDGLTAGWKIAQRTKGHRHSTDDLMTGWYAAQMGPAARTLLDLGAGIGGVGLLALWRAPADATLVAIEAQQISYELLVGNIARNGLEARARAVHGDLRDVRLAERFDLITGSPPYWDVSQGVLPDDPQKQAARFELRGDVRDYCRSARAHLADRGRFVFCFPTVQRSRAQAAAAAAELAVIRSCDVVPRAGVAPLFTLFACRGAEEPGAAPTADPPHVVRGAAGEQTVGHADVRASFGLS